MSEKLKCLTHYYNMPWREKSQSFFVKKVNLHLDKNNVSCYRDYLIHASSNTPITYDALPRYGKKLPSR